MNLDRTAKEIESVFLPHLRTLFTKQGIQVSTMGAELTGLPHPYITIYITLLLDSQYTLTLQLEPPKKSAIFNTQSAPIQWLEPLLGVAWSPLKLPCPAFLIPTPLRDVCNLILLEWNHKQHDLYIFNGKLPGKVLRDSEDIKEAL